MKNLVNFIMRYSAWFVFAFYAIISLLLLVTGNNYQRSVYLTSANIVTGSIYEGASQVTGYFHLKSINKDLQANNALLQNEVLNLKNQLAQYKVLASDSLLPMHYPD
ncbi:MAG: rod shape-determining protein MreC, partial [Muribaculaceae bacterium]|nr:rod shape-determining protein MreC [Muribaculaceae bacterium]